MKQYADISKLNVRLPTVSDGENPLVFMSDVRFALALAIAETDEVVEVIHATWVENEDGKTVCSHCHSEAGIDAWGMEMRDKKRYNKSPYCPQCGARMKGSE